MLLILMTNYLDSSDFQIGSTKIKGLWLRGTENGVNIGIKTNKKGCNIHLTIYFDAKSKFLNAHITDERKKTKKVWEEEMDVREIEIISKEIEEKCVKRYLWYQKYYQLNSKLLQSFEFSEDSPLPKVDLGEIIKVANFEDILIKKRLRTGYKEGSVLGLIFKKDECYMVIPAEHKMFILNSDLRKTPLGELPTVKGIYRYFDYLEEERIYEKLNLITEELKAKVQMEIIEMLGGY